MRLPGMVDGESLDKFHDRCIVLSPSEQYSKKAVVDQFVKFLHQQKFLGKYSVAEVIKGGSLGKGTAVKSRSDVDLVVYLNGINGMAEFKSLRPQILRDLELKARNYHGQPPLTMKQPTPYAVRCTFNNEDMDILPAIKISNIGGLQTVYSAITSAYNSVEEAQNYSASLTTYQILRACISFVSQQSETVKRVIRLVKYWKEFKSVPILSYTVELVTIYASRQRYVSSTQQLFTDVMNLLQNAESLKVAFDDNYNSRQYTSSQGACYVLDPANPFKNTLQGYNTARISQAAQETLRS